MVNRIKLENLIHEVARTWGISDGDLTFEYELLEEHGEVTILLRLSLPRNERIKWLEFWSDVEKHVSKIYDIVIFVEHKR